LDQHRNLCRLRVQQQQIGGGEHEEIRQPLALGRQQRGPDRVTGPSRLYVVGDEALQEGDAVIALNRYDASFG
jgi:hypothetical protein